MNSDKNCNNIYSFNWEIDLQNQKFQRRTGKQKGKAGSTPAIFISKKYPQGTQPYKQGDWLGLPLQRTILESSLTELS